MNIKIHSRSFKLSQPLYDHINSKLHLALGRYSGKVSRVEVKLMDVNGPKGGEDMNCLMKIRINHFKSVAVNATAEDMYDAISICANNAKRVVERHFNRARRLNHKTYYNYA